MSCKREEERKKNQIHNFCESEQTKCTQESAMKSITQYEKTITKQIFLKATKTKIHNNQEKRNVEVPRQQTN